MAEWERFKNETTENLIQLCQSRQEPDCLLSLYVLILRFRKDLLEKNEITCAGLKHGVDVAESITEKTFEAFGRKGNFKSEKSNGDTIDSSFLLYLLGISQNLLIDHHRKAEREKNGKAYTGMEHIITELPVLPNHVNNARNRVIMEVLQSLPYSHRVVYLTYMAHEKTGCNLPKKLQEELRTHLGGIHQATVRAYKKEAMDKINEALKFYELSKTVIHE